MVQPLSSSASTHTAAADPPTPRPQSLPQYSEHATWNAWNLLTRMPDQLSSWLTHHVHSHFSHDLGAVLAPELFDLCLLLGHYFTEDGLQVTLVAALLPHLRGGGEDTATERERESAKHAGSEETACTTNRREGQKPGGTLSLQRERERLRRDMEQQLHVEAGLTLRSAAERREIGALASAMTDVS